MQQGPREVGARLRQPFGGRAQQPHRLDQVADGAVLFVARQEGGALGTGAVRDVGLPGGWAQRRFEAAQDAFGDPGERCRDGVPAGLRLAPAAGEHGDGDGGEIAGAAAEGALHVERAVLEDESGLTGAEPGEQFVAHAGHEVVPRAARPGIGARRALVRRELGDQPTEQDLGELRGAGLRQHRALHELDDGQRERGGRQMDGEQPGGR